MPKISVSEYRWSLKLYTYDHQCLAQDYAGMQKIITLWESFIQPKEPLLAQVKRLKKIIEKSQPMNHRVHTSIHHRLNSFKSQEGGTLFKQLRQFLSFSCVSYLELGLCYLIVQEEEQLYDFLKVQHQKIKGLLEQMYEPQLLESLSRLDLSRIRSLELFLKGACFSNRCLIKECHRLRNALKNCTPDEIPTTSFRSFMEHCKSWGSKAYTLPTRPKPLLSRLREHCAVFWESCVFLWD